MLRLRRSAAWAAAALAVLAPAVSGCQPPWAWGLFLALFLAAVALFVLADAAIPPPRRCLTLLTARPLRFVLATGLLALAWIGGLCLYDLHAGAGSGRLPALALRGLLFVWAFAAAFIAGLGWGVSPARLRQLLRLVFLACLPFACLNLLQAFGVGPYHFLDWTIDRLKGQPSGIYTNPNRHAVLLAMAGCCGAAVLALEAWSPREHSRSRGAKLRLGAYGAGVLLLLAATCVSLSRLTLVALALGSGLAMLGWVAIAVRRRAAREAAAGAPPASRFQLILSLVTAVVVPLTILVVLGLTLTQFRMGARFHMLGESGVYSYEMRRQLLGLGAGLVQAHPFLGYGLGSCETVLRPLLPPEWNYQVVELHSDWLQCGLELGLPGLGALLACAGAWGVLWWAGANACRGPGRRAMYLCGGLAVFIPLFCSLADFPLREPANGVLFFLLAGALAAALHQECQPKEPAVQETARAARWAAGLCALLAALSFLLAGAFAGRIGWATARTPWRGHLQPPVWGSLAPAYRRGLAIAPHDPELLLPYAQCLHAAFMRREEPAERAEVRRELDAALAEMEKVNPRNYLVPWFKGSVCAAAGEGAEADRWLAAALELAPAVRRLRYEAALNLLQYGVARSPLATPARARYVEAALQHLRTLLQVEPKHKDEYIGLLEGYGLLAEEITGLWPGDRAPAVLERAYFWADRDELGRVADELERLQGTDRELPWALALGGLVALQDGALAKGAALWTAALSDENVACDPYVDFWIGAVLRKLPADTIVFLSEHLGDNFIRRRHTPMMLASQLWNAGRLLDASRLYRRNLEEQPTAMGYRLWSELAWRLNDPEGALERARRAYALSDASPEWQAFRDSTEERYRKSKP